MTSIAAILHRSSPAARSVDLKEGYVALFANVFF